MIKHLARHGNSLAFIIDRGILDLLSIEAETPISVTTDGNCLVLTPVRDETVEKRFRDLLAKGNKRYGRMLKRLAR